MSYDFRLCLPRPGRSRAEIATADADDVGITEPVPVNEERKRRVAQALITRNPAFRPFAFGFEEISKLEKITVEEARKKYRHIELNGAEGGNGIQVMLFDYEAAVTVPYWHQDAKARRVFEEIWNYLEIIQREGGFFAYDPQIERVLDLPVDFEASIASYQQVSRSVHGGTSGQGAKHRSAFTVLPEELDRLPYLYRWCALSSVALLLGWVVLLLAGRSRMEALILLPWAGWFICKILWLDPARLRSIGWSPRLTFLSIFPPAALFLQLLLFLLSSRRS